ncbi:unnamed protein product [Larinioides sclopetarius]|uniref:Invertebrate defensins family profile domain-containing protein n=1 Tax=Larinioides sclopetarius TaxID=280406 RepID=A0AAV2BMS2_9ARAC
MKMYAFLLCLMAGAWVIGSEAAVLVIPIEQATRDVFVPQQNPNILSGDGIELATGYPLPEDDENELATGSSPQGVDLVEAILGGENLDTQSGPLYSSNGCPSSSACSLKCKGKGFKWGMCTGPTKSVCQCYRTMGGR